MSPQKKIAPETRSIDGEPLIAALDSERIVRYVNQAGCLILGYPSEEIVGQSWPARFVPRKDREAFEREFKRWWQKGGQPEARCSSFSLRTRDSGKRRLQWTAVAIPDASGNTAALLLYGEESSRQKQQIRKELYLSEERLRAILDTAVDGIITIDDHARIESFNRAAERMFGYAAKEVVGRNVRILMPEPDRSAHDRYLSRYLETGEARIIGIGREVQAQRKDGSVFPAYLSIGEMHLSGRRMFTGVLRDFTEFKRLQEEVIDARNLATIGEMAASVAHEIKNPLAGIGGAVQIIRDQMGSENPHREIIDEVSNQVQRLDETVRNLLMFARPWQAEKVRVEVVQMLGDFVATFRREKLFDRIRFERRGLEELIVELDPLLFELLIVNIFRNAAQAMLPEGGVIRYECVSDDSAFRISIIDSGKGIPREMIPDVFRPFFTTRAQGTGLGLAICKKIMDAHEGSIQLINRESSGTEVALEFPR